MKKSVYALYAAEYGGIPKLLSAMDNFRKCFTIITIF